MGVLSSQLAQMLSLTRAAVRNLALGCNVAALRLTTRPRQLLEYTAESLFLYHALQGRRGVNEANVWDVLPSNGPQDVRLALTADGTWFRAPASYASDIVSLCLICQLLKPRVVFEIGTSTGYTALHFALNTPDDTVIYTLDLPREDSAPALPITVMDEQHIRAYRSMTGYCFAGTPGASKIRCLFGDSARFDFSPFHRSVDFFFIDGAHSYEYVQSDTERALACCRPGAVIAWHDFGRTGVNGVTRWLVRMPPQQRVFAIPGGSLAFSLLA